MNTIYREGKTIGRFALSSDSPPLYVSILSKRTARLVLKFSDSGEWSKVVIPYRKSFFIGNIEIFGFQPQSGLHLAVWQTYRELFIP